MVGYVYLIKEVSHPGEMTGPWTKIGYSKNPADWRMNSNLKYGNPRELQVADEFIYDSEEEAYSAEQKAHEAFKEYHYSKEWFKIPSKKISSWFLKQGAKRRDPID